MKGPAPGALPGRSELVQATVYQKHRTLLKPKGDGIGSDACPVPEGHEERSAQAKPRIQAPVNGGRNYNGPKVAKFLVG